MKQQNRVYNLDLLRIISMFMIVTLHYCTFGYRMFVVGSIGNNTPILWLVYALCFGAVNLYVLISGYFLCESKFKWRKLLRIWLEVLFYSILIWFILKTTNRIGTLTMHETLEVFMPVITKAYWFVSIYFIMYILSPFLNKLIKIMTQKEYKYLIIVGIVLIILNNIIPGTYIIDSTYGYGIVWFVYLYFVGAYIKKYDIKIKFNVVFLLGYIGLSLITFGSRYFILKYCQNIEILKGQQDIMYTYNSLTVFLAAVCLFLFIKNARIKNIFPNLTAKISYSTFGVYLIHTHFLLCYYLFNKILKVSYFATQSLLIKTSAMIISIISVFCICIFIDFIRIRIFKILKIE